MPAGGALFGSAAAGPGSTGGNKHLVETRAGKMNLKGMLFIYNFSHDHFSRRFHLKFFTMYVRVIQLPCYTWYSKFPCLYTL